MEDKQHLSSMYPDLLPLNPDPDLLKLVEDLHRISTAGEPPQYLTASIDAALQERQADVAQRVAATTTPHGSLLPRRQDATQPISERRWKLWHPVTRLGWVIATLALLFSLSAAAYAVVPLFDKPTIGVEHLEASGLGKQLNLSQSAGGYTVAVHWAYADGNQVMIRYDISPASSDDGLSMQTAAPIELRDDQGRLFPVIAGGEQMISSAGAGAIYGTFDAAWLTDATTSLSLHLTMNVQGVTPSSEIQKRITPGVEPPSRQVSAPVGPFNFDFSVPFTAARVAHVGQTVQADGVAVTLDELRVAPSEARAIVRFLPPTQPANLEWRPELDLAVGKWHPGMDANGKPREGSISSGGPTEDGGWYYSWPSVPYDSQDVWTVTVKQLIGYTSDLEPQVGLVGPWTFHVTLPTGAQK